MPTAGQRFFRLIADRHFRFAIAIISAVIVFLINYHSVSHIGLLIMTWVAFAVAYLTLSWIVILSYHPMEVKSQARKEDTTGSFIFLFVLAAAVCSLAGIFFLLSTIPTHHAHTFNLQVVLSFASVFSSWILVHTIFMLRYAHFYYNENDLDDDDAIEGCGLEFPNEKLPDYLDFAYFSFVVGMTFQVSDVQITSRNIRRLVLLHGCLSFLYNTIILALSINIISGIISNK